MRIRAAGGRVILDPSIISYYFPRESPTALYRQYFNYGLAKASTLSKHRTLPTWRPLVPAALVVATAVGLASKRTSRRIAIPLIHAVACAVAATRVADDPGVAPHRALAAFEVCHWAYGLGFIVGLGRIARGRGFDSRPVGHR